jgi:hypothetical protein
MYVLGGALTQSDSDFIKQLSAQGLKLIFVRTKMDDIKSHEEDALKTTQSEKKALENLTGEAPTLFCVSNDSSSAWFKQISNVREYLQNQFTQNSTELLKKAAQNRFTLIAEQLQQKLQQRSEAARLVFSQESGDIDKKRAELERQRTALQQHIGQKEPRLRRQIAEERAGVRADVTDLTEKACKEYRNKLVSVSVATKPGVLQNQIQEDLNHIVAELQNIFYQRLDRLLQNTGESVREEWNVASIDVSDVLFESYEEYAAQLSYENDSSDIDEAVRRLDEISAQIQVNDERYEKIISEIAALKEEALAARAQADAYKQQDHGDMYKFIEGDNSTSNNMALFGKIADIAMLAIPGAGAAEALGMGANAMKAFKAVDTAKDVLYGGKLLTSGLKAMGEVQPQPRTDGKVMDSVYIEFTEGMEAGARHQPREDEGQQKSGGFLSILNMLTLENLFKKIGEGFDTPSRYELDVQKVNQISEEQTRLEQEYARKVQVEIRKKESLGLIKNAQERLDEEKRAALRFKQEKEEKKKEAEERIIANSKKEYAEKFRAFYMDIFCSKAKALSDDLFRQVEPKFEAMPSRLLPYYTRTLVKQIDDYDAQLQNLTRDRASCEEVLKQCAIFQQKLTTIRAGL